MDEMELLRKEFVKCYNELVRQRELIDNNSKRIEKLEDLLKGQQFLEDLLKCKDCKTEQNGKVWKFCEKHWKILKETDWLKDALP